MAGSFGLDESERVSQWVSQLVGKPSSSLVSPAIDCFIGSQLIDWSTIHSVSQLIS